MQFAKKRRRANFYLGAAYVVLAGVDVGVQELQQQVLKKQFGVKGTWV